RSAPPMRNRLTAPTLTPPRGGVWNAECGIEGAGRSPTQAAGLDHRAIHSALRNPHSAFPSIPHSALSGPPPPPLHRHHAGEPNRGQHAERPHPVSEAHVQGDDVARAQPTGDSRLLLEARPLMRPAQPVDELGDSVV